MGSIVRGLTFPCGDIVLEGALHEPSDPGQHPAVVVCHPHPRYGGDMHNNVVGAICRAMPEAGWAALRFNFRGVGSSQGAYCGGDAEVSDVVAALDFLGSSEAIDGNRLAVVGYSFGAVVGLRGAAADPRVQALVAVSPPLVMSDFRFLDQCRKAKLILAGEDDPVIDCESLRDLVAALPEPKELRFFTGVDHFWGGSEATMAGAVRDFLVATP